MVTISNEPRDERHVFGDKWFFAYRNRPERSWSFIFVFDGALFNFHRE